MASVMDLVSKAENGDSDSLAVLLRSGQNNNVNAEIGLGELYYHGIRVSDLLSNDLIELHYTHFIPGFLKDYDEALKWFLKAANQGSAIGQERVGFMYLHGRGKSFSLDHSNVLEAIPWLQKSADQGNADAQYWLGTVYREGVTPIPNTDPDYLGHKNHLEEKWFRAAANQGNKAAQTALGMMYLSGGPIQIDYAEAMKWFLKSAEQGDAYAQSQIGNMYEKGQGVSPDKVQAYIWFLLSSSNDQNVLNQLNIDRVVKELNNDQIAEAKQKAVIWGVAHIPIRITIQPDSSRYYGGVTSSIALSPLESLKASAIKGDDTTFSKLQTLAQNGDLYAQLELGGLYAHALTDYPVIWTSDQNIPEAISWYRKAAGQGSAQAMYQLGQIYSSGSKHDDVQAFDWYRKAANQGYPDALWAVGGKYYNGVGVSQDFAQAAQSYRKAADRCQPMAQINLAEMYEKGLGGLHQNNEDAYYWQLIAAIKCNDGNVALPIDFVERALTPEQLTSAWDRMKHWEPEFESKSNQ
jgi:TPR repeat protein